MNRGKRWLLAAATAGAMLTMIGCEAVQGIDVNGALRAKAEIESLEGAMTLEWKLTPDAATMPDARTAALIQTFGEGALRVTEWKQAAPQDASLSGTIEIQKGKLAFEAYLKGSTLVLDVDGAKQPFRFELSESLGDGLSLGGVVDGGELVAALASESGAKALRAVQAYLVGKTPTPDGATVERVEATFDGASKTVTKVRMETPGDEIDDTLRAVASAVLADEGGAKALLGTLFDALAPSLRNSDNALLQLALQNKEFAVNFLYGELTSALTEWAAASTEDLFTEDSAVAFSVLLDELEPVGTDVELSLSPADAQYDGIRRIEATASTRWWNANGDVAPNTYDGPTATFDPETKPRQRLDNVTEGSLLYDIMKNDLALTTHSFQMYMGANASVPDGVSPYIKGAGTTMVPVRYVSEQLDATVDWNGGTITIKDEADGITIVMAVGAKTATVNGAELTLPESPEIVFQSTFVPIAFITKALGGTASWDAGVVTITKEF